MFRDHFVGSHQFFGSSSQTVLVEPEVPFFLRFVVLGSDASQSSVAGPPSSSIEFGSPSDGQPTATRSAARHILKVAVPGTEATWTRRSPIRGMPAFADRR